MPRRRRRRAAAHCSSSTTTRSIAWRFDALIAPIRPARRHGSTRQRGQTWRSRDCAHRRRQPASTACCSTTSWPATPGSRCCADAVRRRIRVPVVVLTGQSDPRDRGGADASAGRPGIPHQRMASPPERLEQAIRARDAGRARPSGERKKDTRTAGGHAAEHRRRRDDGRSRRRIVYMNPAAERLTGWSGRSDRKAGRATSPCAATVRDDGAAAQSRSNSSAATGDTRERAIRSALDMTLRRARRPAAVRRCDAAPLRDATGGGDRRGDRASAT